jgi:hypothetical protein
LEAKVGYGRFTGSLLSGCQAAYATAGPGLGRRIGKTSADGIAAGEGLHGEEGCKLLQRWRSSFYSLSLRFQTVFSGVLTQPEQQSCYTLINCMVGLIRKSKLRGKCQSASFKETFHRILVAGFKTDVSRAFLSVLSTVYKSRFTWCEVCKSFCRRREA